jgi:hypothetical protein
MPITITDKFISHTLSLQYIPLHFASENLLQSPKLFLSSSLAEGICDKTKVAPKFSD